MKQKGFTPIIVIVVLSLLLFLIGAFLVFTQKTNPTLETYKTEKIAVITISDNDIFRKSDIYRIQTAIYSYMAGNKRTVYPESLDELKDTSYGHFPVYDTLGKPYLYTLLDQGSDYKLETKLDDGSNYIVYGNSRDVATSADVYRSANLMGIKAGLKGFYSDKGYFPQNLNDLIAAGWGMYEGNNQTGFIPSDPITKEQYGYKIVPGSVGFMLTAKLDNGLVLAIRND